MIALTSQSRLARPKLAFFPKRMHVMVLGAGVIGVTTAWYLHRAGHRVSVVERRAEPALETSHANGGQISISHPEPWSSPSAPLIALRSIGQADAPFRFHHAAESERYLWALRFLRECLPWRFRRNTRAIAELAVRSGHCLRALREETGIEYDQHCTGILHLEHAPASHRALIKRAERLRGLGIRARVLDVAECMTLEPALSQFASRLAGGIHAPDDESGDAREFTRQLASLLAEQGVRFHYQHEVKALLESRGKIDALQVSTTEDATIRSLTADAFVVCLGPHSRALLKPLGVHLPIYPLKGYSLTLPVIAPERAPRTSLTDESRRIVCSRLGDRLRVAGTGEINGFDLSIHPARSKGLAQWVESVFPGACDIESATPWTGLRPATPSNVPIIGRGTRSNLWLNTGHGSLGWTLACGSGQCLAQQIDQALLSDP